MKLNKQQIGLIRTYVATGVENAKEGIRGARSDEERQFYVEALARAEKLRDELAPARSFEIEDAAPDEDEDSEADEQ